MERQSGSTTRLDGGSTKIPPHIPRWDHGVGGGEGGVPQNKRGCSGKGNVEFPSKEALRKDVGRRWGGGNTPFTATCREVGHGMCPVSPKGVW